MKTFGWNDLGMLPLEAWASGNDGDGGDMFGDGGLRAGARGQSARAYYDGRGSIDGAWHLPAFSRRPPRKNGKPAEIRCPGAEPPTTLVLRGARWERVAGARVWRRVASQQAAVA